MGKKGSFVAICIFFFAVLNLSAFAETRKPVYWADLKPNDFEKINSAVSADGNGWLLLGNIKVTPPSKNVAPEKAVFSGRWEGFELNQPVPRDSRYVLVITTVTDSGGTGVVWGGADCQTTELLKSFTFYFREYGRVELCFDTNWEASAGNGYTTQKGMAVYRFEPETRTLSGEIDGLGFDCPIEAHRGNDFVTWRDYPKRLAELGINAVRYDDETLKADGDGWLVYLPADYGKDPKKKWPLIYFFHGTGDTGLDITALAKASPFMYIREGNTLPAIILAPALRSFTHTGNRSFGSEYMLKVLEKAKETYAIDGNRVYVTGLSMGGEATYRFALEHPDLVAAAAPLCFGDPAESDRLRASGFKPFPQPYSRAAQVPFWIIQGADDVIIPPWAVEATVKKMQAASVNVKFSMLQGHGHNVWDDTYSDRAFYEWLLDKDKGAKQR